MSATKAFRKGDASHVFLFIFLWPWLIFSGQREGVWPTALYIRHWVHHCTSIKYAVTCKDSIRCFRESDSRHRNIAYTRRQLPSFRIRESNKQTRKDFVCSISTGVQLLQHDTPTVDGLATMDSHQPWIVANHGWLATMDTRPNHEQPQPWIVANHGWLPTMDGCQPWIAPIMDSCQPWMVANHGWLPTMDNHQLWIVANHG